MKVFETVVVLNGLKKDEVTRQVSYVTVYDDKISTVAKVISQRCEEYDETLVSIREVLTISERIENESK